MSLSPTICATVASQRRANPLLGKRVDYTQSASATHTWITGASTLTTPTEIPSSSDNYQQFPIGLLGKGSPALVIDNAAVGFPADFIRAPVSIYLRTDAPIIELYERPDGINSCFHVIANNVMVLNVTDADSFDGTHQRCVIDFGSRQMREIELVGMRVPPDNIYVDDVDTVSEPDMSGPVGLMTGDSELEGLNAAGWSLCFGNVFPRMCGIRKVLSSPLGGTGYSATAFGARKPLRYRVATDIDPYPADYIFHFNGVNDGASLTLEADAGAAFDQIDVSHPDSKTFVHAGFSPRSSLSQATVDAILAATVGRGYVTFDPITLAEITGTGCVGDLKGDGNSDWVVSDDGTHFSDAGHLYIAKFIFSLIAPHLP